VLPEVFEQKGENGQSFMQMLLSFHKKVKDEEYVQFEWEFETCNKERFWADLQVMSMTLNGKEVTYLVCRDISQRKEMEMELRRQQNSLYYQAHHDALTGLPNRTLFVDEMNRIIAKGYTKDHNMALLFFDLDRFKSINDSLGHDIGDKVLQVVSERMQALLHQESILARLGGDEFVLLLKKVQSEEEVIETAKRVLEVIKKPMNIDNYTLYTSASIGISLCPRDDTNVKNLLKFADTAMYQAKEDGGDTYHFYHKEMTEIAYEQVLMEKDLRLGIANNELRVYYQPQYDARTETIIGVEALIRWQHPKLGLLSPLSFIELAKKTGLIVELDLWVMEHAIKEVAGWYEEGLNPGILSLNMTMKQLEYPNLLEVLQQTMEGFGFQASWLELEVTETDMMTKPKKVISLLNELNKVGIYIAIDDFGTGYSSLSHLKRLPIDKLKIDQSFVREIPYDEDAVSIVKTIISLAKNLRMDVIAEGVEEEAQIRFLLDEGCNYIQGYYYHQPLNSEQMYRLLKEQKNR
jgi:diguanylate cyclase (GGDEF)-like protein